MMKNKTIKVLVTVLLAGTALAACNSNGSKANIANDATNGADNEMADNVDNATVNVSQDSWAHLVNEANRDYRTNDSIMTYGNHTYTMTGKIADDYKKGAKGEVTFTNIPSGFTEFKAVYEQFLGKTPYGTAAMLPMAFEIWARDNATGECCLELLCYDICIKEILRELPQHIKNSKYSPSKDPYVQRCMTAATLAEATRENGYNPQEPYTLSMAIGPQNTWKQESEVLQAYTYTLDIIADGNAWSNPKRSVTVQRGWNSKLYKANSCASLYVNINTPRKDWNGLK